MKCVIPGANVRVLARAIHALSRIGDELYVEPEKDKLSFRSVNSARSAYASFTFDRTFFAFYKSHVPEGPHSTQDEELKCKISMKSCLPVFRAPNTLDKQVETCLLHLEGDGSRLVFEFRCRHGIVKTHHMPIIECETLQVVYTKDTTANMLMAPSRLLADAVLNFQATQEEVTLAVGPNKTFLRSYADTTLDPSKVIHTELCLESGEFDRYTVAADASVTFCLKEFRAILAFAEATTLPVSVSFEAAGRPVVFMVNNAPAFEAHFVLATLSPEMDSQSTGSQLSAKESVTSRGKQIRPATPVQVEKSNRVNGTLAQPSTVRPTHSTDVAGPSTSRNSTNSQVSSEMFDNASRLFSNNSISLRVRESDEEQDDTVPGTPPPPPNKKARLLFRRCFEATFDPALIPGHNIVLADDSDEGD